MTLGTSAMYMIPVLLPAIQADFGITRADASLPYTVVMIGFGIGGVLMGRLADRFGVTMPLLLAGASLIVGHVLASMSQNVIQFALVQGLLIGMFGCAATFSPLIADTSQWFVRRRGIAVAVVACGNYLGGVIWPPVVQHFIGLYGWRQSYLVLGIVIGLIVIGLALLMRPRPPLNVAKPGVASGTSTALPFGISPRKATVLLCIAGLGCCTAMSMPQVHIVAYCGDLGYGVARGAEMLSVMLAFGIASRLISGAISDRIGGLRTLLLNAGMQGIALLLFLPFDGLATLYVISALFGLSQGGLVPAYAIIVREHFSPKDAAARLGIIMLFTQTGMALGGWISGKIFDLSGSYDFAFLNSFAFNMMTFAIAAWLLLRLRRQESPAAGVTA